MYSHEELISAVSAVGRDGKTFTVKDVREQLGFDSRDKKELSRFRRRLRAFEKAAADQLEKLGNNSYRLRNGAFEQTPESNPVEHMTAQAEEAPARVTTFEAVEAALKPIPEVPLEPASGVFQSALPANEPEAQPEAQPEPVRAAPALHLLESPSFEADAEQVSDAAYVATPPTPREHSTSTPQRVLSVAGALVSSAFAASAAVSGKVREHSRSLREQLWSCVRSGSARKHAFARLRGWAESVRPLSNEVREQLSALRQRVLASRRRAA